MSQIVTITSQGQLTIPVALRKSLGISGQTKAVIENQGGVLLVKPKKDFWSLSGSLKSSIKLTDEQLRKARSEFKEQWPRKL